MIVIVDAYNILKYVHGSDGVGEREKEDFLSVVRVRARMKQYNVIVVFDGGSSSYPLRYDDHGIEVMYAGNRQSADHAIEALCGTYRGREVVVVSADRMLCQAVKKLNAVCIEPPLYLHRIHESRRQKERGLVTALSYEDKDGKNISSEEFHAMMEKAAQQARVKAIDYEDVPSSRMRPSQKKSRSETILERIIEKL